MLEVYLCSYKYKATFQSYLVRQMSTLPADHLRSGIRTNVVQGMWVCSDMCYYSAIVLEHEGMYEFTKFMSNNKERWSEEHTNIYVHHPILQAL